MDNLRKIFRLVAQERKPCFIAPEDGETVLVVLPLEEYQKLHSESKYETLVARVNELSRQTEQLNQEIIQAQMEEFDDPEVDSLALDDKSSHTLTEAVYIEPIGTDPEAI